MKFIYLAATVLCGAAFVRCDVCNNMYTCQSCIRRVNCTWCSETRPSSDKETRNRCENVNKITPEWCQDNYVVKLKSSGEVTESKPLGANQKESIQIRPQRAAIKLRMGETYRLQFDYAVVKKYPMDLYYLMDLSLSMSKHKRTISIVGKQLADEMKKVTEDFKLGFGSFVDKVDLPFSDKDKRICDQCELPYSFKNHQPLTTDPQKFVTVVNNAKISSSIDSPEGGLDGLLQSMVCTNEIGWRPNARHLLVYSSDALFHIAGDGKLAGIVEPNDGKCHLQNGSYTHGLILDYPSIGQINQKAKENNIIIIFAVTRNDANIQAYKQLANVIEGATTVVLAPESIDVVQKIKEEYEKIVQSVIITDNSTALNPYISVTYYSSCLDPGDSLKNRKSCDGLQSTVPRNKVTFFADIKLEECPSDINEWKKSLEIKPTGLKEKLIVEIEMLCDCPCVQSMEPGTPHPACNNAGSLECGICKCNIQYYGQFCECTKNKIDDKVDNSTCITNNITQEICSNVGICKCGVCDCYKRVDPTEKIYGKYCECDNFSCKRVNEILCSDHGRCNCGNCTCFPGWSGEACDCPEDDSSCIDYEGVLCSNRGTCDCGQCVCTKIGYKGKYCELCPECPGGLCRKYKDCVECKSYSSGLYSHDECNEKCQIKPTLVEYLEETAEDEEARGDQKGKCIFLDHEQKCTFKFNYTETNTLPFIYAQKEKECAAANLWAVIGGVVGGILLIGLFTLILWKILTTIHDHREYMKFEKERANSKLSGGDNPLYKSSRTTYENPTFGKKE